VTIHGVPDAASRTAAVSVTVAGRAPAALASALGARGVIARAGLQCAPLAHNALGTGPDGTLRLSAGPDTGADEVQRALAALAEILA